VFDNNDHQDIVYHEDDAGHENEDVHLTREQHMELKYKFKNFNAEVDIEKSTIKIGMVFSCMHIKT
jgi:hypothetical protein